MSSCPACNKVVDPLRSRFVGVVDGKVVGFCSPECAAKGAPTSAAHLSGRVVAAASAAAAASDAVLARVPGSPQTPSTGVPVMLGEPPRPTGKIPTSPESGPVIEIIREPGSAGAAQAKDDRSGRAKHPDEISMAAFWSADKEREKSGLTKLPDAAADKSGPVKLPAVGKDTGARDAIKDVARSGAKDAKDAKPDAGARSNGKDTGGKDVVAKSDAKDSKSSAKDASAAKSNAKDSKSSAKDAVVGKSGAKDAVVGKSGAKDAVVGKSGAKDAVVAKPGAAPAIEPAPRAASEPSLELPRKSRLPLVLLVLIVIGLGGFALYRMLAKGDAQAATPSSMREPPPGDRVAVAPEGEGRRPFDRPAPSDVPGAATQARDVLVRGLSSTSPRIQHLAAAALARTQDAAARASLVAQLGRENSEIAKLDLAYALARGGDKQGGELLAQALRSIRSEVRDEAARLLALLGDARAIPHLLDLLAVPQRHLGGAEQLARLGEPHGLVALQQLRADPRASADDKARATIALGLAGKLEPAALRALLADPHQNMFAAAALAERRDPAAVPVLVDQLASPALRVRAARALRRLDPEAGPTTASAARLPPLVAALGQGSDPYQLSAAEAILLLTGPAAWAERE